MSNRYEYCSDCRVEVVVTEENEQDLRCPDCDDWPLCESCMGSHKYFHSLEFEFIN